MTVVSVALLEYLRKVGLGLELDLLRKAIRAMSELLKEMRLVSRRATVEGNRQGRCYVLIA